MSIVSLYPRTPDESKSLKNVCACAQHQKFYIIWYSVFHVYTEIASKALAMCAVFFYTLQFCMLNRQYRLC